VVSSIGEANRLPAAARPALTITPNPARTSCMVSSRIPDATGLDLLDAAGRPVRSFRNPQSPVRIDLAGVPPGVYFCRVVAPTQTTAARLLVVR